MGDPTKFSNLITYYIFNLGFVILILSELFIFIYTYQKKEKKGFDTDKGTKWLLYINSFFCIFVSLILVSKQVPSDIKDTMFPPIFSFIGICIIYIGIVIRVGAVLSLKRNFTLDVQTKNSQQLIKTGLYKYIRHPAYTGSILSLLGISLAFKNIYATIFVFISCMICYHIRIRIKEKVLLNHFKEEYCNYKRHTKKLFPKIY